MIFVVATVLIQIACVVHLIRNGRNTLWLWAIIALPFAGSAAYFAVEILPGLLGRREVRAAKSAAVKRLDPKRDLRSARDAVDTADTAANRTSLADSLAEAGHWDEAVRHYREAVARTPGKDRTARFKLARACLEAGNTAEARRLLEELPQSASASENDRAALLLARSLEALGRDRSCRGPLCRAGRADARRRGAMPARGFADRRRPPRPRPWPCWRKPSAGRAGSTKWSVARTPRCTIGRRGLWRS